MSTSCDPATIAHLDMPPDQVAALSRETTQAIAARLHAAGITGFRWWSVFFGEWHNLVVFRDRMRRAPIYGEARRIRIDDPDLAVAASELGIGIRS
jgi:hypothetical protein